MFAAIALAALIHAFHDLDQMCARDAGKMWGVNLCGPTMFADPATRHFVADRNGKITEGSLPQSTGIANTSIDWEGERWTMVMLPLPEDAYQRRVLLAHESFHRVQKQIGLGSGLEGGNAHLDTLDGRYLLQLEWRALAAALGGERGALKDALAFRARRRQLFPKAAAEEQALEMNEGLAQYTGTAFAEPSLRKRIPHLIAALHAAEKIATFPRSFAYGSGPAWGALLERRDKNWTRHLGPTDDLGGLIGSGDPSDIERRAARYGGPALLADERLRDEKKQAMLRDFRARFVDGPILVLPLRKMSFEMNPNEAQPFESYGTIYPMLTLRDHWGTIVVKKGGALITSDWMRLVVPAARDGYELTLNAGWVVVPGGRAGDLTVTSGR